MDVSVNVKVYFHDNVTIYPNEEGWNLIKSYTRKLYGSNNEHYILESLKNHTTADNGYRHKLYFIMDIGLDSSRHLLDRAINITFPKQL